jgi:hypothetical protein
VASVTSATSLSTSASGAVTSGTAYTKFSRITISGGSNALLINAGSSLTISATNSVSIYTATGTTGSISGALTFSGSAHRLNVNDAGAVTFNSGSIYTQGTGFSGNAFTATGVANAVVFANGSTCSIGAGANPFGLSAPSSKVTFNSGSLFIQTSGTIVFSGRTYADFQLNTGSSSSVSGSAAVSINNLIVTGNSTLSWGMTGTPGHAIKGNITVNSGSTLTFAPLAAGTVNLNGTAAQTITGAGTITIGNNATVVNGNTAGITVASGTRINLVTGGILNLNSNPFIFQSTSAGTASIGPITGTLSNATNVTVQRYIPAHSVRTYTLITPGVNGTTMYNGWQEGGASTSGYGTQISGIYAGNGFDFASASGTSSVFGYNDEQNPGAKWESLGTGNTLGSAPVNVPFYPGQGWLLFIRGDRTVGPGSGASTATTLRATGYLTTGTVDFINLLDPNANKYTLIGNPYACAINWSTTSKTALNNSFTVYDPNLRSFVTSDGTTVSPNTSQQQANVIQSGQAFFVQTDNSGSQPDFVVNESDKNTAASTSGSNTVFGTEIKKTQLNINLYTGASSQQTTFADGVVAVFNNQYSKDLGKEDVPKFTNFNETFALYRNNTSLSIEGKPLPINADTLFFSSQNMKKSAYSLAVDASGFSSDIQATLIDNYTGKRQLIDLSKMNTYDFEVNNDAASFANGRFMIVLNNAIPLNTSQETSIAEVDVKISPNPVQNQLQINLHVPGSEIKTVRLLNNQGQIVTVKSLGNAEIINTNLDTSNLPSGIYLVEILKGNNKVFTKKIVK